MSFQLYTGDCKTIQLYEFKMEGSDSINLTTNEYIEIPNPIMLRPFFQVFYHNPEITKNILNSILYPNDSNIIKVEFILEKAKKEKISTIPKNLSFSSLDYLRGDILCECTLKNEIKTRIIDLEVQVGSNIKNTRRIVDYIKNLEIKFNDKIIVLSFIYNSFCSPLEKIKNNIEDRKLTQYKKIYEFDDYIIYQINSDKIISYKEDIWITNEKEIINENGKEWIKYLTLPLWCQSFEHGFYAFPKLDESFFENKYVYDAFCIIQNIGGIPYSKDLVDQHYLESDVFECIKNKKEYIKLRKETQKLKDAIEKAKKKLETKKSEEEKNKKTYPPISSNSSSNKSQKKKKKKTIGKIRKNY